MAIDAWANRPDWEVPELSLSPLEAPGGDRLWARRGASEPLEVDPADLHFRGFEEEYLLFEWRDHLLRFRCGTKRRDPLKSLTKGIFFMTPAHWLAKPEEGDPVPEWVDLKRLVQCLPSDRLAEFPPVLRHPPSAFSLTLGVFMTLGGFLLASLCLGLLLNLVIEAQDGNRNWGSLVQPALLSAGFLALFLTTMWKGFARFRPCTTGWEGYRFRGPAKPWPTWIDRLNIQDPRGESSDLPDAVRKTASLAPVQAWRPSHQGPRHLAWIQALAGRHMAGLAPASFSRERQEGAWSFYAPGDQIMHSVMRALAGFSTSIFLLLVIAWLLYLGMQSVPGFVHQELVAFFVATMLGVLLVTGLVPLYFFSAAGAKTLAFRLLPPLDPTQSTDWRLQFWRGSKSESYEVLPQWKVEKKGLRYHAEAPLLPWDATCSQASMAQLLYAFVPLVNSGEVKLGRRRFRWQRQDRGLRWHDALGAALGEVQLESFSRGQWLRIRISGLPGGPRFADLQTPGLALAWRAWLQDHPPQAPLWNQPPGSSSTKKGRWPVPLPAPALAWFGRRDR
ncbi:MAG: hypothetical protein DWQ01_21105 [Planctomycetota bacterium]|nr:MAG: hypothetical protein DWQ01_21105 [Planctomycetota bacterium]